MQEMLYRTYKRHMVVKYRDPSFCQFIALGFKTLQTIEKQQNAASIKWVKLINEGPVRKI